MQGIDTLPARWELDERGLRERMYRSPTPRERERWQALWLLSRGWSETRVGAALERDTHTKALIAATGPASELKLISAEARDLGRRPQLAMEMKK
jgi:hypothetical protein